MKILAIIPARAGSKGVKNKNIIDLCGKPLIQYTIDEVKKVSGIDRILVSTESAKIKEVADKFGEFVPFLRPQEFAEDKSRTIDVIKHAVQKLKKDYNESYDYICLLQPTSPLRIAEDIENCIQIITTQKEGSVVSLVKIDEPHPHKMKVIKYNQIQPLLSNTDSSVPRQELPPVYELNGAVYLCETKALLRDENFFSKPSTPYIMPEDRSVNINNHFDLFLAKYLIENKDQ